MVRKTERQADRQTDNLIYKHVVEQTDRQAESLAYGQTKNDSWAHRQIDIWADRQIDRSREQER